MRPPATSAVAACLRSVVVGVTAAASPGLESVVQGGLCTGRGTMLFSLQRNSTCDASTERPTCRPIFTAGKHVNGVSLEAGCAADCQQQCRLSRCVVSGRYIGWQWCNFDSCLCQLVFATILWVKLSEMFATVISLKYVLYTLRIIKFGQPLYIPSK